MNDIIDIYPLSITQQGILIESLKFDQNNHYVIVSTIRLSKEINIDCFKLAWQRVIIDYDILRTGFNWTKTKEPIQFVLNNCDAEIWELDWSNLSTSDFNRELTKLQDESRKFRFNLKKPPLSKIILIKYVSSDWFLLWINHHIILDGWSQGLLWNRWMHHYLNNNVINLDHPPKFKNYIEWQSNYDRTHSNAYWRTKLSNIEASTLVNNIKDISVKADSIEQQLNEYIYAFSISTTSRILASAKNNQCSLFQFLLATWSICVSRLIGHNQIIIGIVDSGRNIDLDNINEICGILIRTSPFILTINNALTFKDLVKIVAQSSIEASSELLPDNQYISLIDHLFVMQNISEPDGSKQLPFKSQVIESTESTEFPLLITIIPEGKIKIKYTYSNDIDIQQIKILSRAFENIINTCVSNSNIIIKNISLANAQDMALYQQLNDTFHPCLKSNSLQMVFEGITTSSDEKIAYIYLDESITFREIKKKSNQVAYLLQEMGYKNNSVIGICIPRSIDYIICVIAIFKIGGTFLPIDSNVPVKRKQFMLSDSGADFFIVSDLKITSFDRTILVNDLINRSKDYPTCNLNYLIPVNHIAYIIYTSGSTGQPKGVPIAQTSLTNRLLWMQNYLTIGPNDTVLHKTSISFDVSLWEYLLPLVSGCKTVIAEEGVEKEPKELVKLINTQQCTIIHFVPTMLSAFTKYIDVNECPSIKKIICSGEKLTAKNASEAYEKFEAKIYNFYGPTEATIDVSYHQYKHDAHKVPIGKPIWNTQLFVLDYCQNLLPQGIKGELAIAGINLSPGYINRHSLNKNSFIQWKYSTYEAMPIYLTGDLVCLNQNIEIDYFYRKDNQIKFNGYRIELGEIENTLVMLDIVKEAKVFYESDKDTQMISAFVVTNKQCHSNDIKEQLSEHLPYYMIPAEIHLIDQIPINQSGKAAVEVLSKYKKTKLKKSSRNTSKLERNILCLCKKVLNTNVINFDDNFFSLGGDSISAIHLSAQARAINLDISISNIFKYPTIAELASHTKYIENTQYVKQTPTNEPIYLAPIASWFFSRNLFNIHHYNQALLLESEKHLDKRTLTKCLDLFVEQNDSFRYRYIKTENTWTQICLKSDAPKASMYIDVIKTEEMSALAINTIANRLHQKINISEGPISVAAIIQHKTRSYLLIICHHLIIDIVSWRILIQFIESHYLNSIDKQKQVMPTYYAWVKWLQDANQSAQLSKALLFWQAQLTNITDQELISLSEWNYTHSDLARLSISIPAIKVQKFSNNYHNSANYVSNLILTALSYSLGSQLDLDNICIWLEGHGRTDQGINTLHTIGWFTALYPMVVNKMSGKDIKEIFHQISVLTDDLQTYGTYYGSLKYLYKKTLVEPNYDIVFNFIGNVDKTITDTSWLKICEKQTVGNTFDQNNKPLFNHNINAYIKDEYLYVEWEYNKNQFDERKINLFTKLFKKNILTLINLNTNPIFQLTPMQLGFLINKIGKHSDDYIIHNYYEIHGKLDLDIFLKSWDFIISKFTALRMSFIQINGEFKQKLHDINDINQSPYTTHDYINQLELETFCKQLCLTKAKLISELYQYPLLHIDIIKLNEMSYRLIWHHQHIILDGWSISLIWQELIAQYNYLKNGILNQQSTKDYFLDYLQFQTILDKQISLEFWNNYIKQTKPPSFIKHLKYIQSCQSKTQILSESRYLSNNLSSHLKSLARRSNVTLNSLFLCAWSYIISTYTDRDDISFGVVDSGRSISFPQITNVVGLLINTLPFYNNISEHSNFIENVKNIQIQLSDIYSKAQVSLAEIIQYCQVSSDNLIDHLFIFENYPEPEVPGNSEGLFDVIPINQYGHTEYPFSITIVPNDEILIKIKTNASLISNSIIKHLLNSLEILLDRICNNVYIQFSEMALVSEDDLNLLQKLNNTDIKFKQESISTMLDDSFQRNLKEIALVHNNRSVNYNELNKITNQMILALYKKGINYNSRVAAILDRSIDLVALFIALMRLGATYIPIPTNNPEFRIKTILKKVNPQLVIVCDNTPHKIYEDHTSITVKALRYEDTSSLTLPILIQKNDNIAYIIFTSGSTGEPKGVCINNNSLVNQLNWRLRTIKIDQNDCTLFKSSIGFDISISEMLWPLLAGSKLVIVDDVDFKNLDSYRNIIYAHKCTLLHFSPSYLKNLLPYLKNADLAYTRNIIIGGEELNYSLVNQLSKITKANIFNFYGPTETTITSTYWKYNISHKSTYIGKPIANTKTFVLNRYKNMVPIYATGELYISGIGLASGYLTNDPSERIPFTMFCYLSKQLVCYKTGDRVYLTHSGNFKFLGRSDSQIKLRGYRIELDEIEKQVLATGYANSCAIIVTDGPATEHIIAFYVPSSNSGSSHDIIIALNKLLPEYMIPARVIAIDRIPTNNNGKLDVNQLKIIANKRTVDENCIVNPTELLVINTLKELTLETFDINSDFFNYGGNSLLAMRLIAELNTKLSKNIPYWTIFKYPVIKDFANVIQHQTIINTTSCIKTIKHKNYYLASFAQQRIWFLNKLYPDSEAYHINVSYVLKGILDQYKFKSSLMEIIHKHEMLRTIFCDKDGKLMQKILPANQVFDKVFNSDSADTTLSMNSQPAYKITLKKISNDEYKLNAKFHHILVDGWSIKIFFDDWSKSYNDNVELSKKVETLKYKDYAYWQNTKNYKQHIIDIQFKYWQAHLIDYPELSTLTTDYVRQTNKNSTAKYYEKNISNTLYERIMNKIEKFSLFTLLISCYGLCLSKFNNSNEVLIGTPITSRIDKNLQNIIGLFVNTLTIKIKYKPNLTVEEFLIETNNTLVDAYMNQDMPFEILIDKLNLPRQLEMHPLFQTMFVLHTDDEEIKPNFKDLTAMRATDSVDSAKFDIMFKVYQNKHKLTLAVTYRSDLYDHQTIVSFCDFYMHMLNEIISQRDQHISKLQFSNAYSRISEPASKESASIATLSELFIHQVQKHATKIAIHNKNESITFENLYKKANAISLFINENYSNETNIGIIIENSINMVAAIIGILFSKKTFIPIEISIPKQRLKTILEMTNTTICIVDNENAMLNTQKIIHIESIMHRKTDIEFSEVCFNMPNPAYIIFTSGSTGNPKGVVIGHQQVISYINSITKQLGFTDDAILALNTSLCTDLSYTILFGGLFTGHTIHIINRDQLTNSDDFIDYLINQKINILKTTPSFISSVISTQHGTKLPLEILILGGEILTPILARKIIYSNPNINLINHYGPTETTIGVTTHKIEYSDLYRVRIPIGIPLPHVFFKVLDDNLNELPLGAIGKLFIGGMSLADGYIDQNGSTNKIYINIGGIQYYNTGDLVKLNKDKQIEYIGRSDSQYKIRGFRIELDEIDNILLKHSDIKQSKSIIYNPNVDYATVFTFYIPNEFHPNQDELLYHLKQYLPQHMLPNQLISLTHFPLNQSKKIDIKALIKIVEHQKERKQYSQPISTLEYDITKIWEDVLDKSLINMNEDFFALGGNSLLALKLISRVNQKFNSSITITQLFKNPNIRSMANQMYHSNKQHALFVIKEVSNPEFSLFMIHPGSGLSFCYLPLRENLTNTNMYGINNPFFYESENATSINQLARIYVQHVLKYSNRNHEVILFGWSFGGLIAYEMTKILVDEYNIKVTKLILVDTFCTGKVFNYVSSLTSYDQKQKQIDAELEKDGINPASKEGVSIKKCIQESKELAKNYKPEKLIGDTRVYLIKALNNNFEHAIPKDYSWSTYCSVQLKGIYATHDQMFAIEHIKEISDVITTCLKKISLTSL